MSPLFFLPIQLKTLNCRALLDSGATDNFISQALADKLKVPSHALKRPLIVKTADGTILHVEKYTRRFAHFPGFSIRLSFRIAPIAPQVILGLKFLRLLNPHIDWQEDYLRVKYQGKTHIVHALGRPMPVAQFPQDLIQFTDQPVLTESVTSQEREDIEAIGINVLKGEDLLHHLPTPQVEKPSEKPVHPPQIQKVLQEFSDVFPEHLSDELPPIRESPPHSD